MAGNVCDAIGVRFSGVVCAITVDVVTEATAITMDLSNFMNISMAVDSGER
jgi:hypothetical protein